MIYKYNYLQITKENIETNEYSIRKALKVCTPAFVYYVICLIFWCIQ